MNNKTLFTEALVATKPLAELFPQSRAVASAIEQLEYLVAHDAGETVDVSLLKRINVGVLAAREIEELDETAGALLYKVQAVVRAMD